MSHLGACVHTTVIAELLPGTTLLQGVAPCCRPASTDRVDDDAVTIGIPAGSFSHDAAPRDDSYFFVVLRAPQEVFRRQMTMPIKGLRLGPQLGAGAESASFFVCL